MISAHLRPEVANAILPLGFSAAYLTDFITALQTRSQAVIEAVPGVTPEIIDVGTRAYQHVYVRSFRVVWITVAVFSLVAAIRKSCTEYSGIF